MIDLLKNKNNTHIIANNSHSPIPQAEEKNKQYTTRDTKRERQFQHITDQQVKQILHVVDNNILQNTPILREDFRMTEDIYMPSLPHYKAKKFSTKSSTWIL